MTTTTNLGSYFLLIYQGDLQDENLNNTPMLLELVIDGR